MVSSDIWIIVFIHTPLHSKSYKCQIGLGNFSALHVESLNSLPNSIISILFHPVIDVHTYSYIPYTQYIFKIQLYTYLVHLNLYVYIWYSFGYHHRLFLCVYLRRSTCPRHRPPRVATEGMPGTSQCRGCWKMKIFTQNLGKFSWECWKWVGFYMFVVLFLGEEFLQILSNGWQYFAELYLISPFRWCFVVQSVWVSHDKIVPCGGSPNYNHSFSTTITIVDRIDWITQIKTTHFAHFQIHLRAPKLRVGPWIEACLWQGIS